MFAPWLYEQLGERRDDPFLIGTADEERRELLLGHPAMVVLCRWIVMRRRLAGLPLS